MEYAFITGNTAILDKEFASLPDPSKSIQRVIEMLSDTLSIFQNSYSEPVVIQQCFHQVFYYISASLFNLVLQKKNYCTAKTGFRIKMAISLLETWLVDANNSTKGLLSSIRYIFLFFLFEYFKYSIKILSSSFNPVYFIFIYLF